MTRLILAAGIGLALLGSAAHAGSATQSAMTECRDEAVSTGLEQQADIAAYVEQCMQRFAGLAGYEEPAASIESAESSEDGSTAESEPSY